MMFVSSVSFVLNRARAQAMACAELQSGLAVLETASERKESIIEARAAGLIDDEQTTLLIQAYGLETA